MTEICSQETFILPPCSWSSISLSLLLVDHGVAMEAVAEQSSKRIACLDTVQYVESFLQASTEHPAGYSGTALPLHRWASTRMSLVTAGDCLLLRLASGVIRKQSSGSAKWEKDLIVLSTKVLVKQAVDNSVQGAVEIRQEVAGHVEPLRDLWCHIDWV